MNWCRRAVVLCVVLGATLIGPGCESSNRPTTRPSDRQSQALRDPFNYKPGVDEHDISGGSLGNYDRDAMKRDVDHVLNP